MSQRLQLSNLFLTACLITIGIIAYAVSFQNQMFWDDDDFILHNAYIQDTQHFPKLFSENVIAGAGLVSNYYRPVLLTVFSVEWHMWGNWAPGWHMVNTTFHVANGVFLFWILARLLENYKTNTTYKSYIAFFVALLFLIHPVQVEAVAYANSLGDSLSVFWMFLGILCFQKFLHTSYRTNKTYTTYGWLLASLAAYPLALMSKETAIAMPGLIGLIALLHYRTNRSYKSYRTYIAPLLSFAVLAVTYLALRATTLNFKNSFNLYDQSNPLTESLWVRLLTFCKIIVEYIKLIFWPRALHMERSLDFATSLWDWQVILGGLIIIGLLMLAWKFWRKNSFITFGVLWFFIALTPTSNIIVPINGLLYEHWLYVPIIGVGIIFAGIYTSYRSYKSYLTHKIIIGLVVIAVVALSTRTILRIREWRDPVTFYKQTIQYAPGSYRINNNLAMVLADNGELSESISYYEKAITLDPNNAIAYYNLGNTYIGLGNANKAISLYQKSVDTDPKFLYVYGKLINGYANLGQFDNAINVINLYEKQIGVSDELEAVKNQLQQAKENEQ